MLLPMNSCSNFSLKYQACQFQHGGHAKTFKSPLMQVDGSGKRGHSNVQSSSLKLANGTENIFNRNHLTPLLNKSSVPLVSLQDEYGEGILYDNAPTTALTGTVNVLIKKLDAFYRLSRPYAWTAIIVGIISASFLPVQSLADLTPTFFVEVLKSILPTVMMNIFVSAINQLSDVEIDKVNKPSLPLASGDLSIGEGVATGVTATLSSLAVGVYVLRSPPIVIALIVRWIVGAAYSVNLPLLRWKGNPLMAAVTIIILNGILLQFPYFIHIQKYVFGRPVVFTKPLLFAAVFMGIFNIVLTFVKDIPDVDGDREFGCRTLPVILGKEKVFSICVNMMLIAYGGAVLVGASSSSMLCKLVTMVSHSVMGLLLWRRAQSVDLSENKSTYSFFIFLFKLYYAEFFLMHFAR